MLHAITTIAHVQATVRTLRSPEIPHYTAPGTGPEDPGESVKTRRKPLSDNKLFLQTKYKCLVYNSAAVANGSADSSTPCLCCRPRRKSLADNKLRLRTRFMYKSGNKGLFREYKVEWLKRKRV